MKVLFLPMLALPIGPLVGCARSVPEDAPQTPEAAPPPKHLLLITLDTTRADHLLPYGYPKETSPNLMALAKQGVVFENAISQAAVTPVAHASLLTGLEPYHHGLRVLHGLEGNKLDESHTTLAEVWAQNGGETAAFVSAYPVTAAFGLEQGFQVFDAAFPQTDGAGLVTHAGTVNTGLSQRRGDGTTDAALAWVDSRENKDRRLLLWVHYFDPHDPFLLPPQEFLDMFPPEGPGRAQELIAIYDAEIRFMDLQIGRLLQGLVDRGLYGDTVVAVIADHGEGLGDHDWWSHGVLYQEQIRVPFLLRAPGVQPGSRVSERVRGIDLAPTVLDALAIDRATWPKMDGVSLLPALRTGAPPQVPSAYADSVNRLTYGRLDDPARKDRKQDRLYSLIDGDSKIIFHELEPEKTEFYNLADDPGETQNLAATQPPEMKALLESLQGLGAISVIDASESPTPDDRAEALRALGYVE